MQTPYHNGLFEPKLNATETALLTKAGKLAESLAKMQPVQPALTKAAAEATTAIDAVLKQVGNGAE